MSPLTVNTSVVYSLLHSRHKECSMHKDLKSILPKYLKLLVPSDVDRANSFGGTDIPIICGHNAYTSPFQLYQRKLGLAPPVEMNEKMEWGLRLEEAVRGKFEEGNPTTKLYRPGQDYPGVFSFERPKANRPFKAHASPDAIGVDADGEPFILEVKTTDKWAAKSWGDSGSKVFPMMHRYQVQWYMFVCGIDYAIIAALIGGNDYRWYRVDRNDDLISKIIGDVADFHFGVANNSPPVPTKAAEMKEYLLETRDEHSDEFIKPTASHKTIVKELKRIDGEVKNLAIKKEDLQNKLKVSIKSANARGIQCDDWKATWNTSEYTRIPSYQKYSKELESYVPEDSISVIRDKFTVTRQNDKISLSFPKNKGGK
jgi:putative phage-type endonuclease